jgi:hypothetical protein
MKSILKEEEVRNNRRVRLPLRKLAKNCIRHALV